MTWTLSWAILFLLGLLLLLGYFLSRKVFPAGQEEVQEGENARGPDCEGCGVEGCGGFAKELVRGGDEESGSMRSGSTEVGPDQCQVLQDLSGQDKQLAYVRCQGERVEARYLYSGAPTCQAAAGMEARPRVCPDACLGFGDCAEVCAPRAIGIRQGIARIDPVRCNGCGDCVGACPLSLIEMVPASGSLEIACRSLHIVSSEGLCADGCTGCGDCVEACPEGALLQEGTSIPSLNQDLCNGCGHCVDACPRNILIYRVSSQREPTRSHVQTAPELKAS